MQAQAQATSTLGQDEPPMLCRDHGEDERHCWLKTPAFEMSNPEQGSKGTWESSDDHRHFHLVRGPAGPLSAALHQLPTAALPGSRVGGNREQSHPELSIQQPQPQEEHPLYDSAAAAQAGGVTAADAVSPPAHAGYASPQPPAQYPHQGKGRAAIVMPLKRRASPEDQHATSPYGSDPSKNPVSLCLPKHTRTWSGVHSRGGAEANLRVASGGSISSFMTASAGQLLGSVPTERTRHPLPASHPHPLDQPIPSHPATPHSQQHQRPDQHPCSNGHLFQVPFCRHPNAQEQPQHQPDEPTDLSGRSAATGLTLIGQAIEQFESEDKHL